MRNTWVLVAESSRARLFTIDQQFGPLTELESMSNPEGRMHEQLQTSDLPGRTKDRFGSGRHALEEPTMPKDQKALEFARALAERLEDGRNHGDFQRLVVVAPPAFLGLLRQTMTSETAKLVEAELDKNLVQQDPRSIRQQLPDRL